MVEVMRAALEMRGPDGAVVVEDLRISRLVTPMVDSLRLSPWLYTSVLGTIITQSMVLRSKLRLTLASVSKSA